MPASDALNEIQNLLAQPPAAPPQAQPAAPQNSAGQALSEINAVLAGGPTPAPAAASKPGGVVANIGAGASDYLASGLGMIGDVQGVMQRGVNAVIDPVLSRITGQQPPAQPPSRLGTEGIKDIFGMVGADPRNVEANTPSERVSRAVGGAIPAAVAPYMAGRAAIEAGVSGGYREALARFFGGSSGPGQSGAKTALGAAGNAAIGAGGAVGGQAAEALVPDDSPWKPAANLAGQVVGGGLTAGGMGLGKGAVNLGVSKGKELLGPLSQNYREGVIGDLLRRNARNPDALAASLDTPNAELVPNSKPTLYQLSGDEGIGQVESARRTQDRAPFIERAGEQSVARRNALDALAPATAAPSSVRELLKQHLDTLETEGAANVRRATQNAQQAFDAAGGRLSREGAGALMREQMDAAKASDKANASRLWEAIDPEGKLRIGGTDVRRSANQIFADTPKMARPAEGEEAEIFGRARMLPEVMPFNEFSALRGRLLGAIRDERKIGETPALRRMTQLRQAMDETISGAADNAAQSDAGLAGRLQGDIFNAGPAAQAGRESASRTPQKPQDIVEFLTSRGGVRDDGGELRAMDMNRVNGGYGTGGVGRGSFGVLSRKNGMPPDAAREAAEEAGYLRPGSGISDLFDAIHNSSRGIPHYSEHDADIVANWDHYTKTGEAPPPPGPLPSAPSNFDADAAGRYRAAAGATRDLKQTYNNKIVGPTLQEYGHGQYAMLEANVPERFLSTSEGVNAFLSAGGTAATMRDALVADLRRSNPGDTLDPTRFASWKMRREAALRAFPEVKDSLDTAARAQESVDVFKDLATQWSREFQHGAARHFLNAEPTQAVQSALYGKNPVGDMRDLAKLVANDADAGPGLQRAIIDHIVSKHVGNTEAGTSGVSNLKSDAFQTFMKEKEAALREVFPAAHVKSMMNVATDLQRSNRSIAGSKIPGMSNTAGDLTAAQDRLSVLGRSVAGDGAAAGAGGLTGWLLGGPMGGAVGATVVPAVKRTVERLQAAGLEKTRDLLTEALLNPELARTLMMRASPNNRVFVAQRLNQNIGALTAAAGTQPRQRH